MLARLFGYKRQGDNFILGYVVWCSQTKNEPTWTKLETKESRWGLLNTIPSSFSNNSQTYALQKMFLFKKTKNFFMRT